MSELWNYRAALIRVVDGDTAIVQLDLGFRVYSEQSIRIAGIDAPELFRGEMRAEGKAAKLAAEKWFIEHDHGRYAWPFIVSTRVAPDLSFNRYVGSIWCSDGHSLGEHLVSSGHAVMV